MSEIWFRTDEREDVIASLSLFIQSVKLLEEDSLYWKWSIISLHSAVQGMMAFHLSFGNDLLVMSKSDAEKWLESHETDSEYPETQMDGFLNLYKKIKKHDVLGYYFKPRNQQGRSIKKINIFRNEFIHFMPKGWSIEMSGMPKIFNDCLNVIKALGEGPVSKRWEDENQKNVFLNKLSHAFESTTKISN
jgi:hypothetical protein